MSAFISEMIEAYEKADASTRAERSERAVWIARLGWPESGWLFSGGHTVAESWDDLRHAFIHGSYLATILVGQAFLENVLAGQLDWHEETLGRRPQLGEILVRTRELGWLTQHEFALLDGLRRMRNPYAHYRNLDDKQSLSRRAMEAGEAPGTLVARDASEVVEALYHLVNRHPFALGPIQYPPDDGPTVHPDQMQIPL